MTGNILSCINDGCARPYQEEEDPSTEDQPQDRPANVALVAVAVGNWPFMFVVAKNDIAAGQLGVTCKGWGHGKRASCTHACSNRSYTINLTHVPCDSLLLSILQNL